MLAARCVITTFGLSCRRSNLRADQPEGRPCDQDVSPASDDRVKRSVPGALTETVQDFFAELGDGSPTRTSEVLYNVKVLGRLSTVSRQVDVSVRGAIAEIPIFVAVECKMYGRPVNVREVDSLIGKLLDIGADRGVLYSYSDFSDGAVMRAVNSLGPRVMTVALHTPTEVQSPIPNAGYPADLALSRMAPQWVEDLDDDAFRDFLLTGRWSKWWS